MELGHLLEYHSETAHLVANHPIVHPGPLPHVSGYFWIRNYFFPDSKISTPTSIHCQICASARIQIHSSTQGSSRNIGNRACVLKIGKSKVKSNREKVGRRLPSWIGSIHGKELGWILLRQREKKNIYIYIYIYPYLASTRFRIQSLTIKKFPLWRL